MMQSALTPAAALTRAPQRKGANSAPTAPAVLLVLAGFVAWARRREVTP